LSLCFSKYHAMKTYWGSGGKDLRIIHLDTRWRWVISFPPLPLYPAGNSPQYPLYRNLSGPQKWFGCSSEEEKYHHCPCRELNPGRPTRSLVSRQTELPRLLAKNGNARIVWRTSMILFCFPALKLMVCIKWKDVWKIWKQTEFQHRINEMWHNFTFSNNFQVVHCVLPGSIQHLVQNRSGAHPAPYPMGTRCSFPGGKAAGAWSSPLTSI
jgi:hypothetical protein